MILALDIGNHTIKAGIFKDGQLNNRYTLSDTDELTAITNGNTFDHVVLSTVRTQDLSFFTTHFEKVLVLDNSVTLPFVNRYQTPETLGSDRLAGVAGAQAMAPGKNCLVIDAGTAITCDLITEKGEYLGGAISPGLMMRFQALNTFTEKLPLITTFVADEPLVGTTTPEALRSGVLNGTQAEMNGIIEKYRAAFPKLQVFLTGGDAKYFESKLNPPIFVSPDLVLIGLERIVRHHVAKK